DDATYRCRTPGRERRFSRPLRRRSTDPDSHVAVAAGIPLPATVVAVGVDGAAVEGKATKTAVETSVVKRAAMEGERTRPTVPADGESAAAESASAEPATHGVRAHTATMRSQPPVSTTTVSATTVSAAATRRGNSRGKGDRCTDCGDGGNGHEALSEHDSASLVPSAADPNGGGLRRAERSN